MSGRSRAQEDDETGTESEGVPDVRPISIRELDGTADVLYAYRTYRALEVLLSDPEVNDVVEDMISSFEAYEPYTNFVDSISVQGSPDVEIEGSLDEGAIDVTVVDRQVAYGLVDRRTDELVGLTITEPQDVSWTAWEGGEDEARLRRVLEDSQVQEYVDDNDWYPFFATAEAVTSAKNIEHGGVTPVVLFVVDDELFAVVAYLDVRTDDAGEVVDVSRVDRFVERPPHELATSVTTADDSVADEVPAVPFERRPWYTADDGTHRVEDPTESIDRAEWHVEWDPPGRHGVQITAAYRGSPVFETLESPVTYAAYGLPDRGDRTTLEWFFPDGDPVFDGEVLFWDVHSPAFGAPGPLGVIEYPEEADRPEGFQLRSHYYTHGTDAEAAIHSGHRFGSSSYDVSYDFWADGTFTPIWRWQGPGFASEYADFEDDETGDGVTQFHLSTVTMDVTPGSGAGVEVRWFDGAEWTTPETEFYRVGEPETIVRFSNPDGSETIDLPLESDEEVVVVRRGRGEIPGQQRLEDQGTESAFYHPAQYIGDEPIQGERVIVWLLLEAPTGQVPHQTGTTSFVADANVILSGY